MKPSSNARSAALSRRELLRSGAAVAANLAVAPLLLDLCGCGGESAEPAALSLDRDIDVDADTVLLGLYPSAQMPSPEEAVRHALGHLDFSWLGAGDSVFVKVACNSANAHPAVTSPAAVRAMCRELFARGAG